MKKTYEKPISSFLVISSTDVLATSINATLEFNTDNTVYIDNRDVRSFSGFFNN